MAHVKYRTTEADGVKVFYREAGNTAAPKLLLLHGFPSAGHMFRDLIPLLADRFHMVAPDLPGFGQSDMPRHDKFSYTFDNIARVIERFTEVIGFDRFAVMSLTMERRQASNSPFAILNGSPRSSRRMETPTRKGSAMVGLRSAPIGKTRRRRIEMHSALFLRRRPPAGSTPMACPIRRSCRPTARTSTIFISVVLGPMKSSSICSVIISATSRSIRSFRTTSAPTSRRFSLPGVRTILSFFRPAPMRSSAIFQMQSSASSTPATLRWKLMPVRSPKAFEIS